MRLIFTLSHGFCTLSLATNKTMEQLNNATKQVTLTFLRKEILSDVNTYAYVEGDVLTPEDAHSKHQVMDICEDGNIDRVTRVMDLVFAECTELLYPFTHDDVEGEEVLDDVLRYQELYTIEMNVPTSFSKTTLNLLEKYIHEFIVYRVMFDWMSIANIGNPKSMENWKLKAEWLKEKITGIMNHRSKRIRRTTRPFDG